MRLGKGGWCSARIFEGEKESNQCHPWCLEGFPNLTADQYFFWTITENVCCLAEKNILNNFIRNFLTLGLFIVNPANYCLVFPSIYYEIDHDEINVVRGRCSFWKLHFFVEILQLGFYSRMSFSYDSIDTFHVWNQDFYSNAIARFKSSGSCCSSAMM